MIIETQWERGWRDYISENRNIMIPTNCHKQSEKINRVAKMEKIPSKFGGGEKEVIVQTKTIVHKCDVKRTSGTTTTPPKVEGGVPMKEPDYNVSNKGKMPAWVDDLLASQKAMLEEDITSRDRKRPSIKIKIGKSNKSVSSD